MDFSGPIFSSPIHIFFDREVTGLGGTEDFHQFRVGVIRGSYHEEYLKEHFPAVELALYDGYGTCSMPPSTARSRYWSPSPST